MSSTYDWIIVYGQETPAQGLYLYAFVKRLEYVTILKIARLLYSSKMVIVSQEIIQTPIEDVKSSNNRRKWPSAMFMSITRDM